MNYMIVLFFVVICFAGHAAPAVKEVDLRDTQRERPVKMRIWYDDAKTCDAETCLDTRPVMLLSHGAFGSPREYNWLGFALASVGWNVIGVAHYGESWVYGRDTVNQAMAGRFDLRIGDLQFILDNLPAIPEFGDLSGAEKIVVAGHSSGGFSALSMVGAEFSFQKMLAFCSNTEVSDRSCAYKKAKGDSQVTPNNFAAIVDKRVDAVIAFDPALGAGTTAESLESINVPVLIVGSVENDFLNYEANIKYVAQKLKMAKHVEITAGAGHFIYLDECEHAHKAMGVSLCEDKEGVSRPSVHKRLIGDVIGFFHSIRNS